MNQQNKNPHIKEKNRRKRRRRYRLHLFKTISSTYTWEALSRLSFRVDAEPHRAPARVTVLAGRSTDQRARSRQRCPCFTPSTAAAQGCARPAERDALRPVDQGPVPRSTLPPCSQGQPRATASTYWPWGKKARYAPRNTRTWKHASTGRDGDRSKREAEVIQKDVTKRECDIKYSLEAEFCRGTGVGTCFAVKPGFRNHLRLLCKFSNVLHTKTCIKKAPLRKHLQIFMHFSKVSGSI